MKAPVPATEAEAMPSPFPGMDPYLEAPGRWSGVHSGLIYTIHARLNRQLPRNLVAEIDQYFWVAEGDDRELLGKPDALIPADDADGNAPADYLADPV
ncbi:MAG: DUF4058 family protein, partial [Gemmataceae bacterium]|nr:DUF4058 family protein [Gemmataceae bacterium]